MEWSKMAWLASGLLVAVGLGMVVVRASFAGKYEEPDYTVVQKTDTLEVRDYGPRLLAEVTMGTDRDTGANTGFRTLAAYIFSDETPEGSPIGMTVPVGQYESNEGTWRMWFVMPNPASARAAPACRVRRSTARGGIRQPGPGRRYA